MRYLIPSLSLIVTDLVIRDGVIAKADVENGCWSIDTLEPDTRERLNKAFSADSRVYAVPRRHNLIDYNDAFLWFASAPEQEKARYLVDNSTLRLPETVIEES